MSEQAETPYARLVRTRTAELRARALAAVHAAAAARPFGARVLVFGSFANGKFGRWSDIDLGVSAPSEQAADTVRAVTHAVEDHGFECDAFDLATAPSSLRERILRDGREPRSLG